MLPFGVLTSPASAALSGAIHLAWISESLQEIGQRQSREGLLGVGSPALPHPGHGALRERPHRDSVCKCSGMVPWLPGEGVQMSPWPQPPGRHTSWHNRSFYPFAFLAAWAVLILQRRELLEKFPELLEKLHLCPGMCLPRLPYS